jgi:RNA polymerase sigma-70 factor (ECF subfamily)
MMAPTTDESFEEFFQVQYPRICRALWLGVGDRCEPEDAAQEAFARAFRKWNLVSRLDRPATWVYVVAVREARRQQRRRDRSRSTFPAVTEIQDPTGRVATHLAIVAALGHLTPRQRLAIVLRFHADLSVKQIAEVMQCREGTVKATLHAALAHLRILPLDDNTTSEVDND